MEYPSNPHWSVPPTGQPPGVEHSRSPAAFGPGHPLPQAPLNNVSLPPPAQNNMYRHSNSSSLPPIAGLSQSSPTAPQHLSQQRQTPPASHHQQLPPQSASYTLPALGPPVPQDRQYHEAEIREMEERERQRHQEQQSMVEQQRVEHHSPPNAHAGLIPLQQPTASRIPQALHAPNGLLSATPTAGMPSSLGAPSGPVNVFAGNGPAHELNRAAYLQPGAAPPQHLAAMNQAPPPQQIVNGASMAQGQQPILNDALTYLDQVKVRFANQPDVYNKFLDIMKEFKGQVIDTPGVIDRVSTLFSGHPGLIQGFNTFLPPGYKIEAGWDNDPNSIRVTTPSGSKIQNTGAQSTPLGFNSHGVRSILADPNASPSRAYEAPMYRAMEGGHEMSPNRRPVEAATQWTHAGQRMRPEDVSNANALLMHQQEQRGVTQLQDAVHVAEAQGGNFSNAQSVEAQAALQSAGGPPSHQIQGQPLPGEKRPAVEFNHAISYVNKIKTRFAQHPEIYKQFLEILQTYQKESKPIGEVYSQVTLLFKGASDLLEDFKQFLPESAAHAKQQAAASRVMEETQMSNERGEPNYGRNIPNVASTPKMDKLPPIGHFGPASVTKDNKKRRAAPSSSIAAPPVTAESSKTSTIAPATNPAKRQKITAPKTTAAIDVPIQSPSLAPELPRPMPPTARAIDAGHVLERIKKFLGNKVVWTEFLRVIEAFTNGLISKDEMVAKVDDSFIGQNAELSSTWKRLVEYDGRDTVIENIPAPPENKAVLSNCRSYGPSYRLLPKRERSAKCSGRDAMCYEVLNDEWASHPTWASEDSGFVSHKKNQFEESLHRMEEERHDYDYNIESASRTIQLLEPLVNQMRNLPVEEQHTFVIPYALGGQSEAIWQRVIKKLYDRIIGQKMIDDLRLKPHKAGPLLLFRIKDKVEKWKQTQREWEKIWRDQTARSFWKSLDHQAINAKAENKKYFQPKQLQTDINVKREEQRRQRALKPRTYVPRHQFEYVFEDTEVILDACHMLLTYLRTSWQHNDGHKIESFLKNFIPAFFGLDKEEFSMRMADVFSDTPPNEEDDDSAANDDTPSQKTKRPNGKQNLLRGVLDPGKSSKKDSRMTSKESTPDVTSMDEESVTPTDSQSDVSKVLPLDARWMEVAKGRPDLKLNEPFTRTSFSLYGNLNIYCFMRLFSLFYERLLKLKLYEDEVQEDVRRALISKAATVLQIDDKQPLDFFEDVSPTANFYKQIIKMFESCLHEHIESIKIEEVLRRFYIPCGYQLYNFDKWLAALLKFASQSAMNDAKDRSGDIVNLFLNYRTEAQTTHQTEIDYRKQIEKLAKDGDVYRIIYYSETQRVTMQVFKKDDQTFDSEGQSFDFNFSYYVVTYIMRDWTEGIPRNIHWPFVRRNIPKDAEIDEDLVKEFLPAYGGPGLGVGVSPLTYRLMYDPDTSDWWVHSKAIRARGAAGMAAISEQRTSKFQDSFVKNPKWMTGLAAEEIAQTTAAFNELAHGPTVQQNNEAASAEATGDVVMDEA